MAEAKKKKTDELGSQKKQRNVVVEESTIKLEESAPATKKFFTFPKPAQLESVSNYGELPLRTYESLRNAFVGM